MGGLLYYRKSYQDFTVEVIIANKVHEESDVKGGNLKLQFNEELALFFNKMGIAKKMVLATCAEERTTARMMSCILLENKIYVQTDKCFLKYQQITINPNVALCFDNVQIEGVASDIGHPLDKSNECFAVLYKEHFRGSYDKYTGISNERLLRISPTFITLWEYDNGKPYRVFFDIKEEKVYTEYYECCITE